MSTRSRVFLLSTVLAADLLFFIIIGQYYPEYFTKILNSLPWGNEVEAALIIIGGLLIAIVCALLLFRILLKNLREVLG